MRVFLGAVLFLTLAGCATNASNRPVTLEIDVVFDGMAFWEFSPEINKAPYTFHWHKESLYLWVATSNAVVRREIKVSSCSGLQASLEELRSSIKPAVGIVVGETAPLKTYVWSGHTNYRLQYFSDSTLDSLTLQSIEPDTTPWVPAAMAVKDILARCQQLTNQSR